jgi:hypothetical protein
VIRSIRFIGTLQRGYASHRSNITEPGKAANPRSG